MTNRQMVKRLSEILICAGFGEEDFVSRQRRAKTSKSLQQYRWPVSNKPIIPIMPHKRKKTFDQIVPNFQQTGTFSNLLPADV